MWQFILSALFIILLGIGIAAGTVGCKNKGKTYIEKYYSKFMQDNKLTREEIVSLLKNLPDTAENKLQMGAMCYKVAGPPDRVEYTCVVCGSKTLYKRDNSSTPIHFIDRGIDYCRRRITLIHGIHVELDERQFCQKCSPDIKHPQLILKTTYEGQNNSHITTGINERDLDLLVEFTQGKVIHKGSQGRENLLHKHRNRIATLLGITLNKK